MRNKWHWILSTQQVVSPIYYAMFTSFTIFASAIMFKDYSGQSASSIASELCGFIIVLSGTTALHSTREPDPHFVVVICLLHISGQNFDVCCKYII
ncbi:hypothetical protein Pint_30820 [Pistacia integerrima]|uniref:Uncharacterized protein n=1 Tax=Pistacia integerrima TaxID=434235 RepID=A0ACC0WXI7_9ROSI|nr:hypothetical protein Pint_30820 [Pistacia integerrima]